MVIYGSHLNIYDFRMKITAYTSCLGVLDEQFRINKLIENYEYLLQKIFRTFNNPTVVTKCLYRAQNPIES